MAANCSYLLNKTSFKLVTHPCLPALTTNSSRRSLTMMLTLCWRRACQSQRRCAQQKTNMVQKVIISQMVKEVFSPWWPKLRLSWRVSGRSVRFRVVTIHTVEYVIFFMGENNTGSPSSNWLAVTVCFLTLKSNNWITHDPNMLCFTSRCTSLVSKWKGKSWLWPGSRKYFWESKFFIYGGAKRMFPKFVKHRSNLLNCTINLFGAFIIQLVWSIPKLVVN